MKLENLIQHLEEIRATHGGKVCVDIHAQTATIDIEEAVSEVCYLPFENRIKLIGRRYNKTCSKKPTKKKSKT